jgi:hypothetical protein
MRFLSVLLVAVATISVTAAKDKFQAADFVNRHLNSIGDEPARAAVKNRMAQGAVIFRVVLGRVPQSWNGEQTFVSDGNRFASLLKFPAAVNRSEWFVSDGRKTSIAQAGTGGWTALGRFVMVHSEILREGLWGGALSTGWALSRWDGSGAKLEDRGFKKIDGRQLHRVDYVPKKGSDLTIELYFEPDSFRHVMTVYSSRISGGLEPNASASAAQGETRYELEEHFSDFKNVDNLTLPGRWTIRFSYGDPSLASLNQYDVTEEKILHNVSLDPKNFELK